MANNAQVKHRSGQNQQDSKSGYNEKNHQAKKMKEKQANNKQQKDKGKHENNKFQKSKTVNINNNQQKPESKTEKNKQQKPENKTENSKQSKVKKESDKNQHHNKHDQSDYKDQTANKRPSAEAKDHEVNHKEQSGRFETAFNRVHKALKEMVGKTESDAFVELLYAGHKRNSLIRKYKNDLHQFAKLRNAIVHEKVNADYYIAEPHIEVVERIEEISKEFEKPQTALSIATSPVFYYYEDAYLKDVLKVINKFDFTRFPVYDKDDKYIALLTSTEIIQWMAQHFSNEVIHFEDVRIKELLANGKNYFVTFVTEQASLYDIEELFERYHTRGKKLQAVIITETGDRHGKPIGVITPWDLLDSDPVED